MRWGDKWVNSDRLCKQKLYPVSKEVILTVYNRKHVIPFILKLTPLTSMSSHDLCVRKTKYTVNDETGAKKHNLRGMQIPFISTTIPCRGCVCVSEVGKLVNALLT